MAGLQLLWRKSEFSKYFCMVNAINVVCFIPKGNKKFHNEVISLEFCNVPSEGTLNTNTKKKLVFRQCHRHLGNGTRQNDSY